MSQNLDHLEQIAIALEGIGVRHAFVGGATIELFLDDLAAAQARVTDDVDCIVDVQSRGAHHALETQLREAGFVNAIEPDAPICRWRLEGIVVDIMPVDDAILGFSNPFYRAALDSAAPVILPSGRAVPCLTLGYTIATKVVAFEGRGQTDPWVSKDLEDLVALFDGGAGPVDAVRRLPGPERVHVCRWARAFTNQHTASEWVEGHLSRGPVQYQREVGVAPPLLFTPLDPDLARQPKEAQQFKANRSLRDVEPTVNLWLHTPEGAPVEEDAE